MTGTRPAPPPLAVPNATDRSVARAAYGLVADEYAVVGHTPNLTRDEARALALAVGVGDPTTTVDDGLSFLDVPEWGLVCTRYATERDARGRVALASDSVAVDAATFATLRGDPFRCFPRKQDRPNAPAALPVPRFSASTPAAEAERLAEARRADPEMLRALLAALLAGERVLYVAPDAPAAGVLQSLVLLLPPSLRRLMTFQTLAARAPTHAPRLTIAERRFADFASIAWTRELPRQAGSGDRRADAAADALLALTPATLAAAHALYEELAPEPPVVPAGLLDEVEHVVRYGALSNALGSRDAAAALRALALPRDAREAALLTDVLLAGIGPEALGDAVAGAAGDPGPGGHAALAVATALAERVERGDTAAPRALRSALHGVDDARWNADDATSHALRAVLAVSAAWLGDAGRFVGLADAQAPWPPFATHRPAEPSARATTTMLSALVRARDGDADRAAAALDALRTLVAGAPATRAEAAALGLAVARGAFAAQGMRGAPEPLDRIADALGDFWEAVPPATRDEPLRALLDPTRPAAQRERGAVEAVRLLAARDATDAEVAAWLGAATLRALVGDADARPVAAALAAATGGVARSLGTLLDVAAPGGIPLRGAWPDVLARLAPEPRRAVLVRTLARATSGEPRLDELAATCGALAALEFTLDAAGVDALAPGLTAWAATLPATRGGAARIDAALALVGGLADATDAARLVGRVLDGALAAVRERVRLRRLAAAAIEIEGTRDAEAWASAEAALRGPAAADLHAGERAALDAFFGMDDGALGWLARLWRRAPKGGEGTR